MLLTENGQGMRKTSLFNTVSVENYERPKSNRQNL